MSDYDLIIRGGRIVDGSGSDSFVGDVAITNGKITEVSEEIIGSANLEVDASGKIVTPGFVDVHTHYDGQAAWDSHLNPSSSLGTTTVVVGNCGVGFAPCRPEDRDVLVQLMEGVEEIPGSALAAGRQLFLLICFSVLFIPFLKVFNEQVHLSYCLIPLSIL